MLCAGLLSKDLARVQPPPGLVYGVLDDRAGAQTAFWVACLGPPQEAYGSDRLGSVRTAVGSGSACAVLVPLLLVLAPTRTSYRSKPVPVHQSVGRSVDGSAGRKIGSGS